MSFQLTASLALVFSSFAAAQAVTLSALTPTTAVAQDGAGTLTGTLPVGPMSLRSNIQAITPLNTLAQFAWSGGAADHHIVLLLDLRCSVVVPSASSAVSPGEVLMSVSLPTTTNVWVRMTPTITGPAGSGIPLLRVDIGNDGSNEMTESAQSTVAAGATLGPVPLVIKVSAAAALAVPGDLAARIWVEIVPQGGTTVSSIYAGCSPDRFYAYPTFQGDLLCLTAHGSFNQPGVVVFGLSMQPLVLPPLPWFGSCLLLPSPDLVLLSQSYLNRVLPIPAGARPITLWTQTIDLELAWPGLRLLPSEAYQVHAL